MWPNLFPLLIFVVAEKRKNTVWTCEAMCKGSHGGRLAHAVCELARALVSRGQLMKIATFSTRDLQEQYNVVAKSYVASYQANEVAISW